MRAFIAIEIPGDVINALTALQNELRSLPADINWVKPENIHLTLKFLGEIEQRRLDEIVNACRETSIEFCPFKLRLNGSGAFPNARKPRILWIGLAGEMELLTAMQKHLDERLTAAGLEGDEKAFRPHLTIGRVRSNRNFRQMIARADLYNLPTMSFEVREIAVIESELLPAGPRYTTLVRVPLGAHAS